MLTMVSGTCASAFLVNFRGLLPIKQKRPRIEPMQGRIEKFTTYQPLALYDGNYDRLIRLIPDVRHLSGILVFENHRNFELQFCIVEHSRYTTTVGLTLRLRSNSKWVPDPSIKIRVYHDACVAEVIAYQNQSHFAPVYPYPNPRMFNRFEKRRLNEFLARLLDFCIADESRFVREAVATDS